MKKKKTVSRHKQWWWNVSCPCAECGMWKNIKKKEKEIVVINKIWAFHHCVNWVLDIYIEWRDNVCNIGIFAENKSELKHFLGLPNRKLVWISTLFASKYITFEVNIFEPELRVIFYFLSSLSSSRRSAYITVYTAERVNKWNLIWNNLTWHDIKEVEIEFIMTSCGRKYFIQTTNERQQYNVAMSGASWIERERESKSR